jgi:hypothetical protein
MSLNISKFAKVSTLATIALCAAVVATPSKADAQMFAGWDYAVAGKNNGSGGATYDYQGMAIKEDGDDIVVAINAGMGLDGSMWENEIINHGDLFFNFSGLDFKSASDAGKLTAIKFATTGSQSGVSEVGVYNNVKAKNVTTQNYGWQNNGDWSNWTKYGNGNGGELNDSYGDLNARDTYFASQQSGDAAILNSINTGNKVGGIMMMSNTQLNAAGLDFGRFGAVNTSTFGFKFKRTADFKAGSFIANLFAECGNDGVAIMSSLSSKSTPEPTAMLGMAAVAGLGIASRRRRAK